MRGILAAVALLVLCGMAQAREPLARPTTRIPTIMVEPEGEKPARRDRQKAKRSDSRRAKASPPRRTRVLVVPRASGIYEAESRSINSSIGQQLQRSQSEQRRDVEMNLLRQEIQRDHRSPLGLSPLGCPPASLRC